MPTVPRWSEPQAKQGAFPNARVTPAADAAAFGGGEAMAQTTRAVEGFGEFVSKVAQQQKEKADQLAVLEADRDSSEFETRQLYDPKTGALSRRGKDAFGLPEEVMGNFDKHVEEVEGRLGNDEQKAAFRQRAMGRRNDINRQIQRHVTTEIFRYDTEVTKAFIANEQDAAAANYHTPERVGLALQRQHEEIDKYAARIGAPLDSEPIKRQKMEATYHTHTGVIKRMLANGEDQRAQGYYQGITDDLKEVGADPTELEKMLESGKIKGESQRATADILGKARDMQSALDMAKDRFEGQGEIYDTVRSRIKDEFATRRQAESYAREDMHRSAFDVLDQTADWTKIPDDQWTRFSGSERESLKRYAKHVRDGTEPENNLDVWYQLRMRSSDPAQRKAFMQEDLRKYKGELDRSHMDKIIEIQAGLRKGDEKTKKEIDGYRTNAQVIAAEAKEAGFNPKAKPGSQGAKDMAGFQAAVDRSISDYYQTTGKAPTNDEVRAMARKAGLPYVVEKGYIFDTTKRGFEMAPEEKGELRIRDVPKADRAEIERELRAAKKPVTDQAITHYYRLMNERRARGR